MEERKEGAMLHTAEHIFARALQEQGLDIHVRKADTYGDDNVGKAYIKEIIPMDSLFSAEKTVNLKIWENMHVSERTFGSLKDAVESVPKLRFNQERIDENKEVRVINIGRYDFSACSHRHVNDTSDIICFALKRVSYLGKETEVEFLSGLDALKFLLDIKDATLKAAAEGHFIPGEIGRYLQKTKESLEETEREEKEILFRLIEKSSGLIEVKGVKLSKFYGEISAIVKRDPARCIAITNGQQLTIIKGNDCGTDLVGIGSRLKEAGFSGNINESTINGKADEKIIEELKKEWKT